MEQYPIISKEVMLNIMGFGSEEEYKEYNRKREVEWKKTHRWVKPICAKCGRKVGSGLVGLPKGEKYYCAECDAKSTGIETFEKSCECLEDMKKLFSGLNIQLWMDDTYSTPTIKCKKHNTTASFTYVNQYD